MGPDMPDSVLILSCHENAMKYVLLSLFYKNAHKHRFSVSINDTVFHLNPKSRAKKNAVSSFSVMLSYARSPAGPCRSPWVCRCAPAPSPGPVPVPFFTSSPSLGQTLKTAPHLGSCLQSFLSLPPVQSFSTLSPEGPFFMQV